jgi:hypothetical protein
MNSELSALTPPLLVAVAFLIATGAFIRHEMRRGNKPDDEEPTDSEIDSSRESGINGPGSGPARGSFSDSTGDGDREPGS